MDNRLSSEVHVDKRCRRVQQKMYFLRRLRLFKVAQRVKLLFYHACIESILLYGIADCFGNLKVTLRSQLNRLVCTAMKVVGLGIYPNFQSIFDKVILKQAMKMTRDPSHVLQREFELLPSGRCFRSPMSRYNCYKNSFVPLATRLLNSNSSDKTVWLLSLMLVFFFGYAVFLICIAQNKFPSWGANQVKIGIETYLVSLWLNINKWPKLNEDFIMPVRSGGCTNNYKTQTM